jgi:hypothetical protein|tara:strand:- start:391 stop:603 length:213 start_codon:yes stop_codon:yes gene_type:complete
MSKTDQIKLESVGAVIWTDGIVRPMLANGLPDLTDDGGHVSDSCPEWLEALSEKDRSIVTPILESSNPQN